MIYCCSLINTLLGFPNGRPYILLFVSRSLLWKKLLYDMKMCIYRRSPEIEGFMKLMATLIYHSNKDFILKGGGFSKNKDRKIYFKFNQWRNLIKWRKGNQYICPFCYKILSDLYKYLKKKLKQFISLTIWVQFLRMSGT